MKVVIDTNVWISALISKSGGAREVIRLALQEQTIPQISTTLFLEYEGVMKRQMIQNLCVLSADEQEELFDAFLSTCQWSEIYYLWRPNLDDEGDDFLIELAIASNAKMIITDNTKDLTSGELQFDIEVLTPKQFLERIKQ
jgi:putative PIN family toxin of toxin-antitoxin system